jgi:hypothetical protein
MIRLFCIFAGVVAAPKQKTKGNIDLTLKRGEKVYSNKDLNINILTWTQFLPSVYLCRLGKGKI